MIKAVFIGLGAGLVASIPIMVIGTTQGTGAYVINPSILYFGIMLVGVYIVALPRSREITAGLVASLVPTVLIALQAETCEFSTDVLKPCVEVYSTQQNLTYSATYLIVGLAIGVAFRAWRKQRPQAHLHRVG